MGRRLDGRYMPDMATDDLLADPPARLRDQVLADRFEVTDRPLGWRCRSCGATVAAEPGSEIDAAVIRLSESAADHAVLCGRCND